MSQSFASATRLRKKYRALRRWSQLFSSLYGPRTAAGGFLPDPWSTSLGGFFCRHGQRFSAEKAVATVLERLGAETQRRGRSLWVLPLGDAGQSHQRPPFLYSALRQRFPSRSRERERRWVAALQRKIFSRNSPATEGKAFKGGHGNHQRATSSETPETLETLPLPLAHHDGLALRWESPDRLLAGPQPLKRHGAALRQRFRRGFRQRRASASPTANSLGVGNFSTENFPVTATQRRSRTMSRPKAFGGGLPAPASEKFPAALKRWYGPTHPRRRRGLKRSLRWRRRRLRRVHRWLLRQRRTLRQKLLDSWHRWCQRQRDARVRHRAYLARQQARLERHQAYLARQQARLERQRAQQAQRGRRQATPTDPQTTAAAGPPAVETERFPKGPMPGAFPKPLLPKAQWASVWWTTVGQRLLEAERKRRRGRRRPRGWRAALRLRRPLRKLFRLRPRGSGRAAEKFSAAGPKGSPQPAVGKLSVTASGSPQPPTKGSKGAKKATAAPQPSPKEGQKGAAERFPARRGSGKKRRRALWRSDGRGRLQRWGQLRRRRRRRARALRERRPIFPRVGLRLSEASPLGKVGFPATPAPTTATPAQATPATANPGNLSADSASAPVPTGRRSRRQKSFRKGRKSFRRLPLQRRRGRRRRRHQLQHPHPPLPAPEELRLRSRRWLTLERRTPAPLGFWSETSDRFSHRWRRLGRSGAALGGASPALAAAAHRAQRGRRSRNPLGKRARRKLARALASGERWLLRCWRWRKALPEALRQRFPLPRRPLARLRQLRWRWTMGGLLRKSFREQRQAAEKAAKASKASKAQAKTVKTAKAAKTAAHPDSGAAAKGTQAKAAAGVTPKGMKSPKGAAPKGAKGTKGPKVRSTAFYAAAAAAAAASPALADCPHRAGAMVRRPRPLPLERRRVARGGLRRRLTAPRRRQRRSLATAPTVHYRLLELELLPVVTEEEEGAAPEPAERLLLLERKYGRVGSAALLADLFGLLTPALRLVATVAGHGSRRRTVYGVRAGAPLSQRRRLLYRWLAELVNKNDDFNHLRRNSARKPASKKVRTRPERSRRLTVAFRPRLAVELQRLLAADDPLLERLEDFDEKASPLRPTRRHYRWTDRWNEGLLCAVAENTPFSCLT